MQKQSTVKLSVREKDLNPGNNTQFETEIFERSELKDVFTNHNYSSIIWKDGQRSIANFLSADGFVVDIENGLLMEAAEKRLRELGLDYELITSKRHTSLLHRYHIYIPFSRTVHSYTDYERVVRDITTVLFTECDKAVLDGARYIFGSPEDAHYSSNCSGGNYLLEVDDSVTDAWTEELEVQNQKGKPILAAKVVKHTPICCPFHDDSTSSAFIDISPVSKNHYIFCSACGKTYWKIPDAPSPSVMKDKCSPYHSHKNKIVEIGILGEDLFINEIGTEKLYCFTDSKTKEQKEDVFEYVVKHKHIQHLKNIRHIGDINARETFFTLDRPGATIVVHYKAITVDISDNAFVEQYLEEVFGEYKNFIKQYLAVYTYSNYTSLPTLIFTGPRGSGKNTFAEMVGKIFPALKWSWEGTTQNFNPEVEKKLLIADETISDDPKQYRQLKKLSGQAENVVNKKYVSQYSVPNNMNIILLSNGKTPIAAEREEAPTDTKNNQWFVLEFKPLITTIDAELKNKLEARLGHYIRTELKTVYDSLSFTGYRYSIAVPITNEERALFANSASPIEMAADSFIEKLIEEYTGPVPSQKQFLTAGYIPKMSTINWLNDKTKAAVLRNLVDRGFLFPGDQKPMIGGQRLYCYKMTDKLRTMLK